MKRTFGTALFIGLLLVGGCGKTDQDPPPRFNETLGDGPAGAPLGPDSIDKGVMKDPSSYQPTTFEPLSPITPTAGGGSEAESPEAQAAHTAVNQAVDGLLNMDFEAVLKVFPPDNVKALATDDYIDNLNALSDSLRTNTRVLKEKAAGPELTQIAQLLDFITSLAEPLKHAIVVTVLDEQTARATLDLSRIPPELMTQLMAQAQAIMTMGMSLQAGAMPGLQPTETPPAEATPDGGIVPQPDASAATNPNMQTPDLSALASEGALSAESMPTIPLRKIGDAWKIDLPITFTEEQAELINEAVLTFKAMMDDTTQAMEQAETLDLQTYQQISTQMQMKHAPALMGLMGRAMPLFGPMMGTPETETGNETPAEPAEQPKSEETP